MLILNADTFRKFGWVKPGIAEKRILKTISRATLYDNANEMIINTLGLTFKKKNEA